MTTKRVGSQEAIPVHIAGIDPALLDGAQILAGQIADQHAVPIYLQGTPAVAQLLSALAGGSQSGGGLQGENLLVVDQGGNGDYATLKEALDFISASGSPSVTNTWRVIVASDLETAPTGNINMPTYTTVQGVGKPTINMTGRILETAAANIVFTMMDLKLYSGSGADILIVDESGCVLTLINVDTETDASFNGAHVSLEGASKTGQVLRVRGGRWISDDGATLTANIDTSVITLDIQGLYINNSTDPAMDLGGGAGSVLDFKDCTIISNDSSLVMYFDHTGTPATLRMENCRVEAQNSSGVGLYLGTNPLAGSHFVGCVFIGGAASDGVNADVAYNPAPFIGCYITNGENGLTFDAGNATNFVP